MLGVSLPALRSGNVGQFFYERAWEDEVGGGARGGEGGGWNGRKGWRGEFGEGVQQEEGKAGEGSKGEITSVGERRGNPHETANQIAGRPTRFHYLPNFLSGCGGQRNSNRNICHFPEEKSKGTKRNLDHNESQTLQNHRAITLASPKTREEGGDAVLHATARPLTPPWACTDGREGQLHVISPMPERERLHVHTKST